MRRFSTFVALIIGFLCGVTAGFAQTPPLVLALTADQIIYATGYQTLTAVGHVQISYGTTFLEATRLEFDQANDRITLEGPIRLTDGENVTIVADFAQLSGDLQNGILTSARLVLNQQLQISAVEISRIEGRYNQLFRATASSCIVSTLHPVPFWQIRARRIIHDQEKQQLFFESAQLRLGNVPVFYIPRLRLPDPTVRRASGFLVPEIQSSDTLGVGIALPYFLTLGDYADVTLTPRITSNGSATLGFGFRRRFHNGHVNFDGALTSDNLTANQFRGYLFGEGALKFANGVNASFSLQGASDNTYLLLYGYSEEDRLTSDLSLFRTRRNSYAGFKVAGFHTQSTAAINDTIPFLLGDINYRKNWVPAGVGGLVGLTFESSGYVRRSTVLGLTGRDVAATSIAVDWTNEWRLRSGLVLEATGQVHGDYYQVSGDPAYPAALFKSTPQLGLTLRYPLVKTTAKATHILQPALQLAWSPENSVVLPFEDKLQVEFDDTNLFSLNRFTRYDGHERGLRANIGVGYQRISHSGVTVGGRVGRVFRTKDLGQFSTASGLSASDAGTLATFSIGVPEILDLQSQTLLNQTQGLARQETRLKFYGKRLDVTSSYVWLAKDATTNTLVDRSEWAFDGSYHIRKNWTATADWRYDLVAGQPSSAGVAVTYRNECIKIDLSLSRRFTSSTNVSPSTSVGLKVALEGFGSRADSQAYGRKCSDVK